MKHPYRYGLQPHEMKLLRTLRSRGFALALMPRDDVGNPLNRKTIEDAMLKAGKAAAREIKESGEEWLVK